MGVAARRESFTRGGTMSRGVVAGLRLRRGVRRIRGALAATVVAAGVLGVVGPAAAGAAVPAAPTTIFSENFENVADPVIAESVSSYMGAVPTSMTYTAHPTWINAAACNGVIAAYNTTNSNGHCTNGAIYNVYARGGARAIGSVFGGADDNHALTEATISGTVAAPTPAATLQTGDPIALPGPNRFVAFSVDVAVTGCNGAQPLLRFFLLDGANEIPLNVINPCTAPGGQAVTAATPSGTATWRVGRYATNSAVLFPGAEIKLKITNDQTAGGGNDYVIDNVQVLDATPALDKAFSPASVTTGDPSTLTFTITNTSELGAKSGWSFNDNLPTA